MVNPSLTATAKAEEATCVTAVAWLQEALSRGPCACRELIAEGAKAGFSIKALRNARERLRLVVSRKGYGKEMRSTWQLPTIDAPPLLPLDAEQVSKAVSKQVSTKTGAIRNAVAPARARGSDDATKAPSLSAADRENPAKLSGEALRALAHRRGIARSELAKMGDAKIREQLRYLTSRQYASD
jgi:hypothetical protein